MKLFGQGVRGGIARRVAILSAVALGLWHTCSFAQFVRHERDIENKGLDLHPRPSSIRETGTVVYGVVDLGLVSDPYAAKGGCLTNKPSRLLGIGPGYVGVQASEMLQGGWRAIARLEHGLDVARGSWANDCGLAFDRALWVGLDHREWGRLELGREDHPAYTVALKADPWAGNSVASPGDSAYYARPVDSTGLPQVGSRYRVRAPSALTYTSLQTAALWLQIQASLTRAPGLATPAGAGGDEREYGGAMHLQVAGLHAAVGFQRWNSATRVWPLTVTYQINSWTAHFGLARGETAAGHYRNLLMGAVFRDQGGARPGDWRVGLNLHRSEDGRTTWKAGLGRIWPLSRRTHVEADAGLDVPAVDGRRLRAGIGLRHHFSL